MYWNDPEQVREYHKKYQKRYYQENKEYFKTYHKEHDYNHNKKYKNDNPWYKYLESARRRCNNPNHRSYKYYGEKGIKCYLNLKDIKFLWDRDKADLMIQPSIHRKKSDKNYTIDNCKFMEYEDHMKLHDNWKEE